MAILSSPGSTRRCQSTVLILRSSRWSSNRFSTLSAPEPSTTCSWGRTCATGPKECKSGILFLILFHCHNQNKRHFRFHKISVWLKDFIPSLRCPLDCWPNSFISFTTHRITENAKFASYFIHFNSIFELDQITEVNGNSSKSKIFCPNNVYLQLGT